MLTQASFAAISYNDYQVISTESKITQKALTSNGKLYVPLNILSSAEQKKLTSKAVLLKDMLYISKDMLKTNGYTVTIDSKKKTIRIAPEKTQPTIKTETKSSTYIWEDGKTFVSPLNRPYEFKKYVSVITTYGNNSSKTTPLVTWDLSKLKKEVGTYTVKGKVNGSGTIVIVKVQVTPAVKDYRVVLDDAVVNELYDFPDTINFPLEGGGTLELAVNWVSKKPFTPTSMDTRLEEVYIPAFDELLSVTIAPQHSQGILNKGLLTTLKYKFNKDPGLLTQADLDSITELAFTPERGSLKELRVFKNLKDLVLNIQDNRVVDLSGLSALTNLEALTINQPNSETLSQAGKLQNLKKLSLWAASPSKIDFGPLVALKTTQIIYDPYNIYTDRFEDVRALHNRNQIRVVESFETMEAINIAESTGNLTALSGIRQPKEVAIVEGTLQALFTVENKSQTNTGSEVAASTNNDLKNEAVSKAVKSTKPEMVTVFNPSVLDRFRTLYDLKDNKVYKSVAEAATYISISNPEAGLTDLKYFPKLEKVILYANEKPLNLTAIKDRHFKEIEIVGVNNAVLNSIKSDINADQLTLARPLGKETRVYEAVDLSSVENMNIKQLNLRVGFITNTPSQLKSLYEKKILSQSKPLTAYYEENVENYISNSLGAMLLKEETLESAATTKAKNIVASIIKPDMTEEQKVEAIYGYVTANVKYNFSGQNAYDVFHGPAFDNWKEQLQRQGQDPYAHPDYIQQLNTHVAITEESNSKAYMHYGALVENYAVCGGIADGLALLAKEAGLEGYVVTGFAFDVRHAWNVIKVDGKFKHYDATWDLGHTGTDVKFFQLTDEQISTNHEWQHD